MAKKRKSASALANRKRKNYMTQKNQMLSDTSSNSVNRETYTTNGNQNKNRGSSEASISMNELEIESQGTKKHGQQCKKRIKSASALANRKRKNYMTQKNQMLSDTSINSVNREIYTTNDHQNMGSSQASISTNKPNIECERKKQVQQCNNESAFEHLLIKRRKLNYDISNGSSSDTSNKQKIIQSAKLKKTLYDGERYRLLMKNDEENYKNKKKLYNQQRYHFLMQNEMSKKKLQNIDRKNKNIRKQIPKYLEADRLRKSDRRLDHEYLKREQNSDRWRKYRKRCNTEYLRSEQAADQWRKFLKRSCIKYLNAKRAADRLRKAKKRMDPVFLEAEQEADRWRKITDRFYTKYSEAEKEKDRLRKMKSRSNPDYSKADEQAADRRRKLIYRCNRLYLEKEQAADRVRKANIRQDKKFRDDERCKDKNYHQIKRARCSYRKVESRNKKKRYQQLQHDLRNPSSKQTLTTRETKRLDKNNNLYQYRNAYMQRLHNLRASNKYDRECSAKSKFINSRYHMPDHICISCEGLFFRQSVVTFKENNFRQNLSNKIESDKTLDYIMNNLHNIESDFICTTCKRSCLATGRLPRLCTSNGLKFPNLPECIKNLSQLEERTVAPANNFMQIRLLLPYAINPQLSLKGSVINIPIDIQDIIKTLPRSFDQMATIQLQLKRHMSHRSCYMNEVVRLDYIRDALQYLLTTPLYMKYDITVDNDFLNAVASYTQQRINFVVDPDDRKDLAEVNKYGSEVDKNEIIKKHNIDNDDDPLELNEPDKIDEYQKLRTTECDDDDIADNEILIIDRNAETSNKQIVTVAPGQDKTPASWQVIDDIDELCFPKIFGGYAFDYNKKLISYSDRIKSEARRSDRRSAIPTRILYMAKQKLERTCASAINTCIRKVFRSKDLCAKHVLDSDMINDVMRFDAGYKMLNKIRSSPSYWEDKKRNLLAMIRQLGSPTFFLTLSAAEMYWPELLKTLSKLIDNKIISSEAALNMSNADEARLIQNDPVTCARYYNYRIHQFMKYLRDVGGAFYEYRIIDSYVRVEFQARGSPHVHTLLWCDNDPPKYMETDDSQVVKFIDRFITCKYEGNDEKNAYLRYQRHVHKNTCYKGRKNRSNCRFDIPQPVMPRTLILTPLDENIKEDWMTQAVLKIKKLMHEYYKNPQHISFKDTLKSLDLTESRYILALRSSLLRTKVFLRRESQEVGINAYNNDIINLFESNMDIQYITDPYACASYILNYISKTDVGMTKFLKEAAQDVSDGNVTIKNRLRKVANVFLNSNVMSAQEAAYHVMGMPLSISSRATVFINTSPIEDRVRILKPNKVLQMLDEFSCDIYLHNIQEKYSMRPIQYENVCMADYVAVHKQLGKRKNVNSSQMNNNIDDDNICEEPIEYCAGKQKILIIRYRRYKLDVNPTDYYREKILLFVPWRIEYDEVENINHAEKYMKNLSLIETNQAKYSIMSDVEIDEALEKVHEQTMKRDENEIEQFENDQLDDDDRIDIFVQADIKDDGIEPKKTKVKFNTPTIISSESFHKIMQNLNSEQKMFVMHILYLIKNHITPFHIFLSGSAGVGKSITINAIYQCINIYYNSLPNKTLDVIHVLLSAFSGMASYHIGGQTLHAAFALPVAQYRGQMPDLSDDTANSIREKLFHMKLLIIDEVSMVGARVLSQVDTRLQQIMGINEPFGGISVIIVGDLNQLPPVMDQYVFKNPSTCYSELVASPARSLFFNLFCISSFSFPPFFLSSQFFTFFFFPIYSSFSCHYFFFFNSHLDARTFN